MKNKIKKILTATVVSALSISAVGCGTNNTKLAKNIDSSMSDFVSSINNLDYVETSKTASATAPSKYGKIVETSANAQNDNGKKIKVYNSKNGSVQFLNNKIDEVEIENTITRPENRNDNFKLFVLSESPFVTISSDDNQASLNMSIKFSTNKIEETSTEIESKINTLILKRSILMIYVNEIYNGNVNFTEDDKVAINAYVNVIKENTSYLNGNRGMVKNQLGLASGLVSSESNENLINYYIIKSGEALETRASKLDSAISAIDSIIKIIETNLSENSNYYKSNLSFTYDNLVSAMEKVNKEQTEITKTSTNKEIADSISNSLNFDQISNSTEIKTEPTQPSTNTNKDGTENNSTIYQNNLISKQNLQSQTKNNTPFLNTNTENRQQTQNTRPNSYSNMTNGTQNFVRPNNQNQFERNQIQQNQLDKNLSTSNRTRENNTNQQIFQNNFNRTTNQNNSRQNNNFMSNRPYFANRRGVKTPSLRINNNQTVQNMQNLNSNQNELQITTQNENEAKSVNTMNKENEKIMRADRTSEKLNTMEEYTASAPKTISIQERATNMPHTTNFR